MHCMQLLQLALAAAGALPRGVNPKDAAKYRPAKGMFACLSDPSIKIPFDRVNDDYCDCPDGSDEPGTGACSNGKFWCENKGHIGQFVPSRIVRDGKCDYDVCCDGSDEAEGVCPDMCKQVNKAYVEAKEAEQTKLQEGLRAREQLLATAAQMRADLQQEIHSLEMQLELKKTQLKDARDNLDNLKQLKKDGKLATEKDPQLEAKFEAARQTLRLAYGQLDSLKAAYEAVRLKSEQLSTALEFMKRDYNPNFNDAAVKQAIHSWEDITSNSDNEVISQGEMVLRFNNDIDDALEYIDALFVPADKIPAVEKSYWSELSERLVDWAIDMSLLPARKSSGNNNEHSEVKDAQKLIEKIQKEIEQLTEDIQDKKLDLDTPKGPEDAFRALQGQCVKNKYGEYDYELCFFDKIEQNGNGHRSNLGRYESYKEFDDHVEMYYTHGAQCWNGPERSAKVSLWCGAISQITLVGESEKCVYEVDVLTPAACKGGKQQEQGEQEQNHDEL